MPEIALQTLLADLPPEPKSVLGEIKSMIADSRRKMVVLDDDPTGTQTVHDVSVLTEWTIPLLQAELESDANVFYILTNSRSLSQGAAIALGREIGENIREAVKRSGQDVVVVSRGDSTLRGHFPGEVEALAGGLSTQFDGLIIAPFFNEGGRYTIADIHYVVNNGRAIPAGETEFAQDPVFGYSESNLRRWVTEKTVGRITEGEVESISIQDIRTGTALQKLLALRNGQICIINAACDADMEHAVLDILKAEALGRRYLYRTAASFVRARAGIETRNLLTAAELATDSRTGGLVIVGSFVPKTTAQLENLRAFHAFVEIELDARELLDEKRASGVVEQAVSLTNQSITVGRDVLIYTSRTLVTGQDAQSSLQMGHRIAESLVTCVRELADCPRFLVAKGGITSSDVATKGLNVRKARVLGQILPGVSVWRLGNESRFPGMNYVVFPGNVGNERGLSDVLDKLGGASC